HLHKTPGFLLMILFATLFRNYQERVINRVLTLVIYTFFLLLSLFRFFFYNYRTLLEFAAFYLFIDCFAAMLHLILSAKSSLQFLHRLQLLLLQRHLQLLVPLFLPRLLQEYLFPVPYSFPPLIHYPNKL